VQQWVKNGYKFINRRLGNRNRANWQTPEVLGFLTNQKTLIEWAHLSLQHRVMLIEKKFGIKISIQTLSTLYKKHKIGYIKPQYAYCRKMQKKNEIAEDQVKTVMDIAQLMHAGKQVIYIDETSFHKQQIQDRVWLKREMTIRKPDGRGRGVTVVGAISEKQGLVHFTVLLQSNNAEIFSTFVSEMVRKVKGEAYVYMDNLSVHTASQVKMHFNERIQQKFLPPYSCALNPIERLRNVAKQKWKRLMVEQLELVKTE
jgi:transposase